jgi:hypothetical protein
MAEKQAVVVVPVFEQKFGRSQSVFGRGFLVGDVLCAVTHVWYLKFSLREQFTKFVCFGDDTEVNK